MSALRLASVLLSLALVNAAPPACTPDYGKVNDTSRDADLNLREQYGNNGAAIGMYSIHVGTYSGFESDITENLPPLTQTTSDFIVPLRQAKIKCNTCTASDGSLKYAHPYKKPVVDFHDLEGIFEVGSTVIGDIIYKYCGDVNSGVCQDSPSYCSDAPPGQETPNPAVEPSVREYIKINLAAFGTGAASAKGNLPALQRGAVYPYYKCLATYGSANATKTFEDQWFGFMRNLLALNATGCV